MNPGQRRSGIFISYRREETAGQAGRLYDRLSYRFGADRVFIDVDSISIGVDFPTAITEALSECDILLALIGREWSAIADSTGRRRIDDPDDFVRVEIEAALRRDIRVVPVLVDGAGLPQATDLPPGLLPLLRRQALMLSHASFQSEVSRLIEAVDAVLGAGLGQAAEEGRNTDRAAAKTGSSAGKPHAAPPVEAEEPDVARDRETRPGLDAGDDPGVAALGKLSQLPQAGNGGAATALPNHALDDHALRDTPFGAQREQGSEADIPSPISSEVLPHESGLIISDIEDRSARTAAKIAAWGANPYGCDVPEHLVGVLAIAASPSHNLAITSRRQIASWGRTDDYKKTRRLSDVDLIAAGKYHSLALTSSGAIEAWIHSKEAWNMRRGVYVHLSPSIWAVSDKDSEGRLQKWRTERKERREKLERERLEEAEKAQRAAEEAQRAVEDDRALNQLLTVPSNISGVMGIAAGAGFSIALCKEEVTSVACWGPYCPEMDLEPEDISDLIAIDAGDSHCIGLKQDGTVVAWGKPRRACEVPLGLTDVIAIAAGQSHNLALVRDGTVAAWGKNDSRQCDVPTGLTGVVAVAAGESHSLALRNDGTVVSWGGSEDDRPPEGLAGVRAIAASSHSLAIYDETNSNT